MSAETGVIERSGARRSDYKVGEHLTPKGETRTIPREGFDCTRERKVLISAGEAFVAWHDPGRAEGKTGEATVGMVGAADVNRLAEELSETYSRFGWGRIEVLNLDIKKNKLTIVMRDSPVVKGASDTGPICWHARSSIEVIVSVILGVEATALEVACEAANRDHCEFRVCWKVPQASERTCGERAAALGFFTTANTLIR